MRLPRTLALIFAPFTVVLAYLATMLWSDTWGVYEAQSPGKPFEVHSPDGAWTLFCDSTIHGTWRPPQYRLAHGGELVWTKELPFILRGAQVANDGTFAGVSTNWSHNLERYMRLLVIGVDGTTRFEQWLPYEASYPDGPTYPFDEEVVLGGDGVVLFRVLHEEEDRTAYEDWVAVDGATGSLVSRARPSPALSAVSTDRWLEQVVHIADTTLFACGWSESDTCGSRIVLCDASGAAVWEFDSPHDFDTVRDRTWHSPLRCWARESGQWLRSNRPNQFDVVLAATSERVTFEVARDELSTSGWSVREMGRQPFELDLDGRLAAAAIQARYLPLEVEFLGSIELESTVAPQLERIEFASIDADARSYLADAGTHAVHVFDAAGRRTAILELGADCAKAYWKVGWIAASPSGELYVGVGQYGFASRYVEFDSAGKRMGVSKLDGNILFQSGSTARWRESNGIWLLDRRGRNEREIEIGEQMSWPWSVIVAPNGALALRLGEKVRIFSRTGEPLASLDTPGLPEFVKGSFTGRHLFLTDGFDLRCITVDPPALRKVVLGEGVGLDDWTVPLWREDLGELCVLDAHAQRLLRYRVRL